MIAFVERVVGAAHKHPLFSVALVIAFFSWVTFSLQTFATQQEMNDLRGQVVEVRNVVERGQLEQRIYSLEDQIYALERIVSAGEARDVDHSRLSRLRSDLGAAKREIERFDRYGGVL